MPLGIEKLIVFGGNGFVGQAIMRAGLRKGLECISVSRRGEPEDMMHELEKEPNFKNASWSKGDVMELLRKERSGDDVTKKEEWMKHFNGDSPVAVVSCIGMFSTSNDTMKEVNGDGNAALVRYAKSHGARRFAYISAYEVENELPFKLLPGYFEGKRIAEQAVKDEYPTSDGIILQPGMVYGTRKQNGT